MIATLLVKGSAPPSPSICRGSGLPKMDRMTLSLIAWSFGKSSASRYTPLLVPPRMIATLIRSDSFIEPLFYQRKPRSEGVPLLEQAELYSHMTPPVFRGRKREAVDPW